MSVVYVCELPEVKGRFDIEKARKFFTRAGPHYGLLQVGKSVMSHDGVTMVRFSSYICGYHISGQAESYECLRIAVHIFKPGCFWSTFWFVF